MIDNKIIIDSPYIGNIKVLEIDSLLSNLYNISFNFDRNTKQPKHIDLNYQTLLGYVSKDKSKWVISGDTRLKIVGSNQINHLIEISDYKEYKFINKNKKSEILKVVEFKIIYLNNKLSFVFKNDFCGIVYVDTNIIDRYKKLTFLELKPP